MLERKIPKDFGGSLNEAAGLIADGNIGALTSLTRFLDYRRFYPRDIVLMYAAAMKHLRVLDTFNLHGEQYWNFYTNICKTSHDNLFAFTQGYINSNLYIGVNKKLIDWRDNATPFDFDKLFLEVKLTEPHFFENPVLIEAGEDKEITPNLIDDLKSKFNNKK